MDALPMDAARWSALNALLDDVLDAEPEDRATVLDTCPDLDLRAEARDLLDAYDTLSGTGVLDTAFDAAALEPETREGQRVGPWVLGEVLGMGGMGVVYAAERTGEGFRQRAALKLVRAGSGADFRARFLRERGILAGLDHPGVARLLDGGLAPPAPGAPEGVPYLALERVDGVPITDYAEAHALGLGARLDLVLQVCDAVAYAHRRLVVHRDLKPSNVLVSEEPGRQRAGGNPSPGPESPRVKLLDFGVAKLLSDDGPEADVLTRTGLGPLSPAYAAPEQVTGGEITTATDVYALGVVLYELLAGERPYDVTGLSASEAERRICETDPAPPSVSDAVPAEVRGELGRDLDGIVLQAMAKDPSRRYPSADELAEDLRRWLEGRPVEAPAPTPGYLARRVARRHPWAVVASLAVLLSVLAGAGAAVWQAREAQRAISTSEEVPPGAAATPLDTSRASASLGDSLGDMVVTTTAASGAGSLHQAIVNANAIGGGTISFDIPGPGPHTIAPEAELPALTVPVVVDGFTQPGSQPNTGAAWQPTNAVHQIVLKGTSLRWGSGLILQGDSSVVRGLAVVDFPLHGLILEARNAVVEGCALGTDDAGTWGIGNGYSGVWVNGAVAARIGGPAPASRNVISGNGNYGVLVFGAGSSATRLQNNFLGTDPAGATALANAFSGVFTGSNVSFPEVSSPSVARDVRIGGSGPGEGNLISGNGAHGIEIFGTEPLGKAVSLGDTRIQGNRIGTNAAGTASVPNERQGILVRRNVAGLTIGGTGSRTGNLVSGNVFDGIRVEVSEGVVVERNLVGTDVTGTRPLGNFRTGIVLACARNATVRGNVVGANGTGAMPHIGSGIGLSCPWPPLEGSGNRIVGNWVGTDRSGTRDLGNAGGNGQSGITASRSERNGTIGGESAGEANVIAFNNGPGITVRSDIAGPVAIGRNRIYGNSGLGIDLEPTGRDTNDPGDADEGANRLQNHPADMAASVAGGTLTLTYTVDTAPANATYPLMVDVYLADPDGEEGQRWVGRHPYTTPQVPATAQIASAIELADGARLVATARDAAGNTSEFSDPVVLAGAIVTTGPARAGSGAALPVSHRAGGASGRERSPVAQPKTTVLLPWTRTRPSRCQRTARASTSRSSVCPSRLRSSTDWRCETRATPCSMIGPSSRSSVT